MMLRSNRRLPLCAVLSYSLSFPCYAELTIAPGDSLYIDNLSVIENHDWIDNQGEVINNGYIYSFYNSQLLNSGVLLNNGDMTFDAGSQLHNFAELTNTGLLAMFGAAFYNYGNFDNAGGTVDFSFVSSVMNTGIFTNDGQVNGGPETVFNNVGVLNNNQYLTGQVNNTGTVNNSGNLLAYEYLINQASGILNNFIDGLIDTSKIDNIGEFNNQGAVVLRDGYDPASGLPVMGEISNSGVFNHDGTIDNHGFEPILLTNSGEFNNNGFITSGQGINIRNSGVFNNNISLSMDMYGDRNSEVINTGLFNNNADIFGMHYLENSGTFENNGTVHVSGELINRAGGVFNHINGLFVDVDGRLDNQGEFNNQSVIRLFSYFDYASSTEITAELSNSGVFNHNGTIEASAYPDFAINNSGEFNNYGNIYSYDSIDIRNSGVFNNFMYLDRNSGSEDSIVNSGVFNNEGGLAYVERIENTGVFNNNRGGIRETERLENSGTFENNDIVSVAGELVNRASGVFNNIVGWLVEVNGVLDNQGQFNNRSEIIIEGHYDSASSTVVQAELNNSGEFNNDGRIYSANYEGLVLNNSGTFNNIGTINVNSRLVLNNSGLFSNNYFIENFGSGGDEINNSGVFINNYQLNNFSYLNNSAIFENNSNLELQQRLSNNASGIFNNNIWSWMAVTGTLDNQGEFNNSGQIVLSGARDFYSGMLVPAELNNAGVFNHYEAAYIDAWDGLVLNNSGEFNRLGNININSNFVINNSGTFNNGNAYSYSQQLILGNNSAINNYATLNNYAGIDGSYDARIINTGVLNNYSFIGNVQRIDNAGVLNNQLDVMVGNGQSLVNLSSGVINNGDMSNPYGRIHNAGSMDNRGTINNTSGAWIELGYASTFTNSGSLINNGDINGVGDINNSGTIINNSRMAGLRNITSNGEFMNDGYLQAESMQVTGGILKGQGSVDILNGLVITEAGTLAPGNSTGFMEVYGGLNLDGTLQMEFDWGASILHDQLNVSGNVILGADSVLDISFLSEDFFSLGQSFDLMLASDISGEFGSFYYDALWDDSLALQWEIFSDYGNDILRVNVVSAVPLPAAVWLFLSGFLGLTALARRKRAFH